jgi:hypothetical protein
MPIEWTNGEARVLVGQLVKNASDDICNYIVIALRHSDHQIITASQTNREKTIGFLEDVLEGMKRGIIRLCASIVGISSQSSAIEWYSPVEGVISGSA